MSEEQENQSTKLPEGRIPVPLSVRIRQFRSRIAPLAVFLISVFVLSILWKDFLHSNPSGFEGRVAGEAVDVRSPSAGLVKDVYVKPFQKVTAGDLLIVIDKVEPDFSEASINLLKAEMELFKAEQSNRLDDTILRYQRLRLELLENKTSLASKKVELNQSIRNYKRIVDLAIEDISSQQDNEVAKATMEALQAEVGSLQELVGIIEKDLQQLSIANPDAGTVDPSLKGYEVAFQLAQARLNKLQIEHGPVEIRAPISGVVTHFVSSLGRHVFEGDELLSIESDLPTSIVAFIPEPIAEIPAEGTKIYVRVPHRQKIESQITSVGARLKEIPIEFIATDLMASSVTQFGLPIKISVPKELDLKIPGQKVYLSY